MTRHDIIELRALADRTSGIDNLDECLVSTEFVHELLDAYESELGRAYELARLEWRIETLERRLTGEVTE